MTAARSGFFAGALRWLRAGYPDGVPATDRIPLVALLHHRLSGTELDRIVQILIDEYGLDMDGADAARVIKKVALQNPSEEDQARVASRLAAAGWPLSSSSHDSLAASESLPARGDVHVDDADDSQPAGQRPAFLRAVIGWLTAGYPMGIPAQDYIPLLALLRRRLSDEEVGWVAQRLIAEAGSTFDRSDIGVLITKITNEMPGDADIARVQERVESAGLLTEPPGRR